MGMNKTTQNNDRSNTTQVLALAKTPQNNHNNKAMQVWTLNKTTQNNHKNKTTQVWKNITETGLKPPIDFTSQDTFEADVCE